MDFIFLIIGFLFVYFRFFSKQKKRQHRTDYYHEYLKTAEWQRKRFIVLERDKYRCVYCGAKATQVHHKRYAKNNIGKEPIEWLVSVCDSCHQRMHGKSNNSPFLKDFYV